MDVVLKSKHGTHYATGKYDGSELIVLKGSKINQIDSFPKMPRDIRNLRNNSEIVSPNGVVLQNVVFSSPSAAAVFVTGRSSNGYIAWRIEDKVSLKEYRKE